MAATQGYNATVTYDSNSIGGANSVSINLSATDLDITEFGDTAMTRIMGLFDAPVEVSGFFDDGDTAQAAIYANFLSRTSVTVTVTGDGTNGYSLTAFVQSLSIESSPDGLSTFSASLVSSGAPTPIP